MIVVWKKGEPSKCPSTRGEMKDGEILGNR
jgi:hypothetical protein